MSLNPITLVNLGTTANDGTGDNLRAAFQKTNNNFSYLSSYSITNVTNGMIVDGTQGYRKLVLTGTGTIANVWINLPAVDSDGQQLQITSLVPITSCYVHQNNPLVPQITFLSNSFFSGGNVSVNLTYTTTNNTWMTF
jgi:hypothetical protein